MDDDVGGSSMGSDLCNLSIDNMGFDALAGDNYYAHPESTPHSSTMSPNDTVVSLHAPPPEVSVTVMMASVPPSMWQDDAQHSPDPREIYPPTSITSRSFISPVSTSSAKTSPSTSPSSSLSPSTTVARGWINYGGDSPPPRSQTSSSDSSSNESLPLTARREKRSILRSSTSPYDINNGRKAQFPGNNKPSGSTSNTVIELLNFTFKQALCKKYPKFARNPEDYFYAEVLDDININSVCLLCPPDSQTTFTPRHARDAHSAPGEGKDPFIYLACCEAKPRKPTSLFVKSGALKRHFNSSYHNENRFRCPYCCSASSRPETVARHLTKCRSLKRILSEGDGSDTSD
ncbi:uncharacterized protein BT62DRAFT_997616 [Guyanagaster necrorhizus]|nr:uncharacterized protein BT62DRAFT_997616 [Guyanagaster necrorhizus MCA 3950]KAG7440683.1 hypothetical protein BT62DRAFT_997616 [Guyanagaster necrorhizus MCA 3950]